MKKILTGLFVAGLLAGCNEINPSSIVTTDLNTVSSEISSAWTLLSGDAAPAACAVAESVSSYGFALQLAGSFAGISPTLITADLNVVNGIANGSLCKSLLAGQTVNSPTMLIAEIGKAIAKIETDSQGIVTAIKSTSLSNKYTAKLNHKNTLKLLKIKHSRVLQ